MNQTDKSTSTVPPVQPTIDQPIDPDPDFASIDGPIVHRSQRFPFTILRIGRILTKQDWVVREVTLSRLSRLMKKHGPELPAYYSPRQIHDELYQFGGEIRGGGMVVEWLELGRRSRRSVPDYHFTFTRLAEKV